MALQGCTLEADLVSLRETIHTQLENYVSAASNPGLGDCPETLRESVAYSLLAGGKRLRPVLVLLACEACGGDVDAALPAACAIEMVHTYSLIHDDLPAMDNDDYRRGRLTNHKVFGEGLAILAGDALLTLAFEIIAKEIQPGSVAAACCADLASAAGWCGMVAGQVADIEAENREGTLSGEHVLQEVSDDNLIRSAALAQLESIHRRKTGRLLSSAVTLGARIAQVSQESLHRLEQFGNRIGLAFQIADDLLDVTGDAKKLGKGVRKDASLGKMTYPKLLGINESRQRAEALNAEGCQFLTPFGDRAGKLIALAQFVTQRDH